MVAFGHLVDSTMRRLPAVEVAGRARATRALARPASQAFTATTKRLSDLLVEDVRRANLLHGVGLSE
jgi:hypothetical protein